MVLSRLQIEKILGLCENNPKLFNTSELIKVNRACSYLSFVLKEIKDYISAKHTDGTFFEEIRYAKKRIDEIKSLLNNM